MAYDATNVNVGKPSVSGALHVADYGTPLPTSADEELDAAFEDLGYISDDGVTNSNSPDSTEIKAWGGDTVLTTETSKPDTYSCTLIESNRVAVLKVVYGDDNVSGDLENGITIKANSTEHVEKSWVLDMIGRDDRKRRIVIPAGKISEIGDISYTDADPIGYEITISAFPDSEGNTHYDYIGKKGTTAE